MRAVVLVMLASCSFMAVRGPEPPPQPPGDCTTSSAAPAVDRLGEVVGGVGTLLGVLLLIGASNCSSSHPPGYNADSCTAEGGFAVLVGLPSAVAAITYGISAHYGNDRVHACRARKAEPPPGPPPVE